MGVCRHFSSLATHSGSGRHISLCWQKRTAGGTLANSEGDRAQTGFDVGDNWYNKEPARTQSTIQNTLI